MAKDPEKSETGSKEPAPEKPAAAQAPDQPPAAQEQAPPPQQRQVVVDASKAHAAYSNFCRVTGTPEELIIDFGLNSQPLGIPTEPIEVTQRIVLNYFTAKRMLAALHMSVQRHEAAFGVLETDIQKRVKPGILRPAPQQ